MKKVKNVELESNSSSLNQKKEGKVQKGKQVTAKKIKAVGKTVVPKLAPKKLISNFKKDSNDGDKNKKEKKIKSILQKVEKSNENELAVQTEPKGSKDTKNRLESKTPPKEKIDAALKKIEKKKAKKLALKLKKRLKKAQSKNFEKVSAATPNIEQTNKNSLGQKVKNDVNKDLNKKHMPLVNDNERTQKLEAADNKNIEATSSKALKKKLKKALKKQLIKDQKLEIVNHENVNDTSSAGLTNKANDALKEGLIKDQKLEIAGSKNVDATSSKVLKKKENKALKRQLIKDQKLTEKPTRDPAVEEATVFVGNLPVNTKRVQLERIFKKFGPVNFIRLRSAGGKVLHKHKQRKLAGSLNAYVVLQSKEKAEKALSLNGVEFKGNHLRVTLATKKPESEDHGEAKRTVFIGNLKYSATEESLREIFSSCGEIEYVRCIRDGDKGCKGVAYVCFKTADAVGLALELNETIVDERSIHVERYNVKKLGAKKARDAQAEKEIKLKTGAKLRLEGKKNKKVKTNHKSEIRDNFGDAKKLKKSEFRGVKVEGLKRKQKPKKKKSNDQMLKLAKKIAPKPKNQ